MSDLFIQQALRKRVLLNGESHPKIKFHDNPTTSDDNDAADDDDGDDDDNVADDDDDSKGEAVIYLDEEQMRREFGRQRDITKKFTVRLCAYEIRQDGQVPFVVHAMQFDGQVFDYPQFTFQLAATQETSVYFQNECLQHLAEIIDEIQNVEYRGYVLNDVTDDVYVFYDIAGKKMLDSTPVKRVWVTIDELLNQRFVLGHPVQRGLPTFFHKHSHLIFLYTRKGTRIYVPEVMYLCDDGGNDGYVNVDRGDDGDRDNVDFLDNRISHSVLGNFYVFSKFPLRAEKFTWRRFVGFCQDAIYLTQPLRRQQPMTLTTMSLGEVIPSVVNYFSGPTGPTGTTASSDTGAAAETGATGPTGSESFFSSTSSSTGTTGPTTGTTSFFNLFGSTGTTSFFSSTSSSTGTTGAVDTGGATGTTGDSPKGGATGAMEETGSFFNLFASSTGAVDDTGGATGTTGDSSKGGATGAMKETGSFFNLFASSTGGATGSSMTYGGDVGRPNGEEDTTEKKELKEDQKVDTETTTTTNPEDDPTHLESYLSNQSASCIYFQEISNTDERIPFWCMKSDDYYVEI